MVPTIVPGEHASAPKGDRQANVDQGHVHLIVTPTELDILVNALRSVGNLELADRFEAVLRQLGQNPRPERED
jgi:hypothetical protein